MAAAGTPSESIAAADTRSEAAQPRKITAIELRGMLTLINFGEDIMYSVGAELAAAGQPLAAFVVWMNPSRGVISFRRTIFAEIEAKLDAGEIDPIVAGAIVGVIMKLQPSVVGRLPVTSKLWLGIPTIANRFGRGPIEPAGRLPPDPRATAALHYGPNLDRTGLAIRMMLYQKSTDAQVLSVLTADVFDYPCVLAMALQLARMRGRKLSDELLDGFAAALERALRPKTLVLPPIVI